MLVTKAVLGLVWFFVAYVVRFCVNVFLEPQINPIKHFPVVTVGHKLLFPAYKLFAKRAGVDHGRLPRHGPCPLPSSGAFPACSAFWCGN